MCHKKPINEGCEQALKHLNCDEDNEKCAKGIFHQGDTRKMERTVKKNELFEKMIRSVKNETEQLNTAHECGTCEKKFKNAKQLDAHEGFCTLQMYQCDKCGKRSTRWNYMHKHVQMAHTKVARIGLYEIRKCQKCPYECSTYQTLREHREDIHSESSTNENLIHDEKLNLKEELLNNSTKPEKEKQDFKEKFEAETAKEEKQYECKKCKLKLNKKILRDHVCHTQKKTECECCGYEFLSEPHLKHHKELITKGTLNLVKNMSPIPIDNPSEKVGEEDITFEFFELCEECGLTRLLDIAHTKERCDKNQFPFYDKISSEFIAEVLNASQNKAAIQKAIEENRCTYSCEHCRIEKKSREAINSHLNENTCMCGYIGICNRTSKNEQSHSQIHKQFEASKENNENEVNENLKMFEKILEEKRALITEKIKQVELYKQLEEVEEDVVKNIRDTIQKEIRELKEFTEAYEKIKNINLHLTNEVDTKNDKIALLKEEILINRTNFEKDTSTADNEKQKIKEDLEL